MTYIEPAQFTARSIAAQREASPADQTRLRPRPEPYRLTSSFSKKGEDFPMSTAQ